MLLAQLGISREYQGQGIGTFLLMQVFRRALSLVENVGFAAIVTDPIDQAARKFYAGFNFEPLNETERMIIPMRTVITSIARI
ncbi:MAG: GNAT family N-acetyltransferase [Vulcanimicrobiaceae bacterium]